MFWRHKIIICHGFSAASNENLRSRVTSTYLFDVCQTKKKIPKLNANEMNPPHDDDPTSQMR